MGREEGSGWGTRVCLWRIHFDIWQNQYNIVKFKNKIKLKIKLKKKGIEITNLEIRYFIRLRKHTEKKTALFKLAYANLLFLSWTEYWSIHHKLSLLS